MHSITSFAALDERHDLISGFELDCAAAPRKRPLCYPHIWPIVTDTIIAESEATLPEG
jgi:hypothetical protein